MSTRVLNHPLDAVGESELARLVRVANPLLAGRPLLSAGLLRNKRHAGQGYEFLEHRDYAVGDDMRFLDWRATARSRHPQIRRFCDEQTTGWCICLDCSASMTVSEDRKWNLAVQLTAALGYLLLHLGHRISVLGFSDHCTTLLPPGRGRQQYARLARALRNSAPLRRGGDSDLLQCLSRAAPCHGVIVVSDFLSPRAMQPALRRMVSAGCGLQLIHILDEAEFGNPSTNDTVDLLDVESLERRTLTPTREVLLGIRAAWSALRAELARFCTAHGISYTACEAGEHWRTSALRYINSLRVERG